MFLHWFLQSTVHTSFRNSNEEILNQSYLFPTPLFFSFFQERLSPLFCFPLPSAMLKKKMKNRTVKGKDEGSWVRFEMSRINNAHPASFFFAIFPLIIPSYQETKIVRIETPLAAGLDSAAKERKRRIFSRQAWRVRCKVAESGSGRVDN